MELPEYTIPDADADLRECGIVLTVERRYEMRLHNFEVHLWTEREKERKAARREKIRRAEKAIQAIYENHQSPNTGHRFYTTKLINPPPRCIALTCPICHPEHREAFMASARGRKTHGHRQELAVYYGVSIPTILNWQRKIEALETALKPLSPRPFRSAQAVPPAQSVRPTAMRQLPQSVQP